ncbi:DUF1989 domain-containing protein [Mycolicibacterium sp.]|uniref:DUF1989 domain-containing protein n=1 Tax=Mycolicibacterium sp. TaxID=2320850 RepID=UPI003D14A87B
MTTSTTDAQRERLLERSPHLVPTPIDAAFYDGVRAALPKAAIRQRLRLADLGGAAVDVHAGETLDLRLLEGPQIVNLFAYNPHDPDERIWHQSVIREGLFTTRGTRIWGTMARNRPLLTVVEDTVCADPRRPFGQHHIYFGGSGTPAEWRFAGGADGVRTTWEQLAELLEDRDVDPALLLENVCFFQKSTVDQLPMRVEMLASDAAAGDHVTLFAEIDLVVLLALSPYEDGGRPAHEIGTPQPKAVEVSVSEPVATPLPWPYEGISYPDMSRYLDDTGRRTREPVSTPGIDHRVRPAGDSTNGKAHR